jgi:hypothetical protein
LRSFGPSWQPVMSMDAHTANEGQGEATAEPTSDDRSTERRGSGARRRARDRLLDRGVQDNPVPPGALRRVRDIENLLLFVDDDLRQTALAMTRIEAFLSRTMQTLGEPDLRREHIAALARDLEVLDHLDSLGETLESLRRRLGKLAMDMK